jgi:integrase
MSSTFLYSYSAPLKTYSLKSRETYGVREIGASGIQPSSGPAETINRSGTEMTVSEYLMQWLLDVESRVSLKTFERYDELCRKSLQPLVGHFLLEELKPLHISKAYAQALTSGNRKVHRGLAPRTVHHMHTILKCALQQAVDWELITRNPATAVRPPRVPRRMNKVYDFQQTAELLRCARRTQLYMPIVLAVLCGLRRGEIVGLRWCDVDFKSQKLLIVQSAEQTGRGVRYKEPKSGRTRSIALSRMVSSELSGYQAEQRARLASIGKELSAGDRVVMLTRCKPVRPDALTHEWVRFLKGNPSLPTIRFHDLRHTHATHLLASGVHPKVASERLGHAQVGITLDTYSHVLPNMQAEAAELVDKGILEYA